MFVNNSNIEEIEKYIAHDNTIYKIELNFEDQSLEMLVGYWDTENSEISNCKLLFQNIRSFLINSLVSSKYESFEIMLATVEIIDLGLIKMSINAITMASRPPLILEFEFAKVQVELLNIL